MTENDDFKCRFLDMECKNMPLVEYAFTPRLRFQWCLNCLLGRIAREISLLRVSQS